MLSISCRSTILALLALAPLGCSSVGPYQGMTEQELYLLGRSRYEEGEYDEAVRALDRFILLFESSPEARDARLLLGHAHFANGDFITARAAYSGFLDRYYAGADAAVAAFGVCRSLAALSPHPQRDQTYTEDAVRECRNVVQDYRGSAQAAEAEAIADQMTAKLAETEYLAANFYFRRGLFDSAITYYEFVVRLYPDTEWAPQALLGVVRANRAIGYDDLADEARDRLLAAYPDSPAATELRADGAGK